MIEKQSKIYFVSGLIEKKRNCLWEQLNTRIVNQYAFEIHENLTDQLIGVYFIECNNWRNEIILWFYIFVILLIIMEQLVQCLAVF